MIAPLPMGLCKISYRCLEAVLERIQPPFNPLAAEIPGFKPGACLAPERRKACAFARGGSLINDSCFGREVYKNKKGAPDFSSGVSTKHASIAVLTAN